MSVVEYNHLIIPIIIIIIIIHLWLGWTSYSSLT